MVLKELQAQLVLKALKVFLAYKVQ